MKYTLDYTKVSNSTFGTRPKDTIQISKTASAFSLPVTMLKQAPKDCNAVSIGVNINERVIGVTFDKQGMWTLRERADRRKRGYKTISNMGIRQLCEELRIEKGQYPYEYVPEDKTLYIVY